MRILLVEDDKNLNTTLCIRLKQQGYEIDSCLSGEEGLFLALNSPYDLMILDRKLPVIDGLSILKAIRNKNIATPVLLLTALNTIQDRIDGLDLGADDYLSKPFEIEELFARIRALMRRPPVIQPSETFVFGNSYLDTSCCELFSSEHKLSCSLTPKENEILTYFIKNEGKTLTRERLLNYIWGMSAEIENRNLDNYIYFLRKRLRFIQSNYRIKTLKGTGFILEKIDDTKNS